MLIYQKIRHWLVIGVLMNILDYVEFGYENNLE